MTKLELKAIRALPEDWIVEGVHICIFGEGMVLAMRSTERPQLYLEALGKWMQIDPDKPKS